MAGITASQYLRRKAGIVVSLEQTDDANYCVVSQHKQILSKNRDDPYASLCYSTLKAIFLLAVNLFHPLRNYQLPPSSMFFGRFNVEVVHQFDRKWYETQVVPELQGKSNANRILRDYTKLNWNSDSVADKYEIYDWIVTLMVLLREMKLHNAVKEPDTTPLPIEIALQNLAGARFISAAGAENFMAAIKAVHPNAKDVNGVIHCDPREVEGFSEEICAPVLPTFDWNAVADVGGLDQQVAACDAPELEKRVALLLQKPVQTYTSEEKEFITHGGVPDILVPNKGGIGLSKLKGLGNVAGEGTVGECVERLTEHLLKSLSSSFSAEQVRNLAAGRIARMQSDRRVVSRDGKLYLEKR